MKRAQKEKSGEQKVAEADVDAFRKHLGPFVVAAETTRMAMVFTNAVDPNNPIIFANNSFLKLTGFVREEVLGRDFNSLLDKDARSEALAFVKEAFAGTSTEETKICFRRRFGGDVFLTSLLISPVRDEHGKIVQHFVSFVDLTDQREEQAHTELLIDELNHRVKNTLATVHSIVSQSLRNSADPAVIRESIESRLFALAESHDLLTRENWKDAGLLDVTRAALAPFGLRDERANRFRIDGLNIRFSPKVVLALSIALHELATNAVKYGACSNDLGFVEISWAITATENGDRLLLCWQEKNGPPVAPPLRKGFGSRVIERGLAHELRGEVKLDYQPAGIICTIDIPARQGSRDE